MTDDWTPETLYAHMNSRFDELLRAQAVHAAAHDRILDHLEEQTVGRAEWNEARSRLQEATTGIRDRLTILEAERDGQERQRTATSRWYTAAVTGLSFILSVVLLLRIFLVKG